MLYPYSAFTIESSTPTLRINLNERTTHDIRAHLQNNSPILLTKYVPTIVSTEFRTDLKFDIYIFYLRVGI
jgi:hypothetical protein